MSDVEPTVVTTHRLDAAPAEEFHVSELVSENPGAMSPFGEDIEFPLPLDKLRYRHPDAKSRPHLAATTRAPEDADGRTPSG